MLTAPGTVFRVPSQVPGQLRDDTPAANNGGYTDYVVTSNFSAQALQTNPLGGEDAPADNVIHLSDIRDDRVLQGFGHALHVLAATPKLHDSLALKTPEARVIDWLADPANTRAYHEQAETTRQVAFANLCMLTAIRDANRELLAQLEKSNPIGSGSSVMLDLAQATHESWLVVEKSAAYYVAYTPELHAVLSSMVASGALLHAPNGKAITLDEWNNPTKKFKIKQNQIDFGKVDKTLKASFDALVGADRDTYMINTVAGEWQDLLAISGDGNWNAKRPRFLYGLQADSVAGVYASICRPEVWDKLDTALAEESGQARDAQVMSALVDVLRAVNLSWRVNNPWSGWNSPLQNRPFGLADIGGIGLEDILKDAVVLKAILTGLDSARKEGSLSAHPLVLARLKGAFDKGIAGYLDRLVDRTELENAVRANQQNYV